MRFSVFKRVYNINVHWKCFLKPAHLVGEHVEELESSYNAGGNGKCYNLFGKQFWKFLKKLNTYFPCDQLFHS